MRGKIPYDPWSNPELAPARRRPLGERLRGGRNRVVGALALGAVVVAGASLVAGEHGVLRLFALDRDEARLRADIGETEGRIGDLRDKIENLDRTIEETARTRYGMARRHEEVYEIVPGDSAAVLLSGEGMLGAPREESGGPEDGGQAAPVPGEQTGH